MANMPRKVVTKKARPAPRKRAKPVSNASNRMRRRRGRGF